MVSVTWLQLRENSKLENRQQELYQHGNDILVEYAVLTFLRIAFIF